MRTTFLAVALLTLAFAPQQSAFAQSPGMPYPYLVVKDADGKVIAPVTGLQAEGPNHPWIILDIDGVPAFLQVDLGSSQIRRKLVYFSEADCTGDAYMYPPGNTYWWDEYTQTSFGVVGPDPDEGTYRLFRTTSPDASAAFPLSYWADNTNECRPESGQLVLSPSEEVLPNPFEGFHGPTAANPERVLTIEGGTRLP